MKLFLALVVSLQLFTSWAVPVSPYVAVACDGAETLALAELAVDHINEDLKHGYKLSLDRIENAQEKKEANGTTVHFLDFDIRETKCHVLSRTPVKDCEIRSFKETKVDGDCKVLVETKAGAPSHVTGYKCETSPDSAKDVAEKCPDCPHLIPFNSTEAQHAAEVSLAKFNRESNHYHTFEIEEITRAATRGPGTPVMVEYISRETTCVKGSPICTLNFVLHPDRAFCTSTVTPVNAANETIDQVCVFVMLKVSQSPGPVVQSVDEGGHDTAAAPGGDGDAVGTAVGEAEGDAVGTAVGEAEGDAVGTAVGEAEGDAVGTAVGEAEGDAVGTAVGEAEGDAAGTEDHDSPPEAPHTEGTTPGVENSDPVPKRKRSAQESSESSEEFSSSPGKQVIHFPDLPADAATCPMRHKYPEDQ